MMLLNHVATSRLTRNELGWLLAQEARGAARALREGVDELTQSSPGTPTKTEVPTKAIPVATSLAALDDAIELLGQLQAGKTSSHRGRIDLAALLYQLAPNVRISIEPGAGTEIFGDEGELRRMFNLIISQASSSLGDSGAAEVRVHRQDEWVKIGVELGPDSTPLTELERRWLSRMATRHGGRIELDGGAINVLLPADASTDQNEVALLRRELDEAQQQGEAYARELAQALVAAAPEPQEAGTVSGPTGIKRFSLLVGIASAMAHLLRTSIEGLEEELGRFDEQKKAERDAVRSKLAPLSSLLAQLERVRQTPTNESFSNVDVSERVRKAAERVRGKAEHRGVSLELDAAAPLHYRTRAKAFDLMLDNLFEQAVLVTPQGGLVRVRVQATAEPVLEVEDGGPGVPSSARQDLLNYHVDPSSLGRPAGIRLLVAQAVANYMTNSLRIGETSDRRTVMSFDLSSPREPRT